MLLGIAYKDENYQFSNTVDLSKGLKKPKLILSGNIKLNQYLNLSYLSEHINIKTKEDDPYINIMPFRKQKKSDFELTYTCYPDEMINERV